MSQQPKQSSYGEPVGQGREPQADAPPSDISPDEKDVAAGYDEEE